MVLTSAPPPGRRSAALPTVPSPPWGRAAATASTSPLPTEGGYSTLYAHCSRIIASSGASVKEGDVIAEVGETRRGHRASSALRAP